MKAKQQKISRMAGFLLVLKSDEIHGMGDHVRLDIDPNEHLTYPKKYSEQYNHLLYQ